MQCVVLNCAADQQGYVHRFPRSSFLYERWRQAIEIGTGESFPKDVDPLEVVICQQHFTGFDGYQEPVLFHNSSLDRQIRLDCCRLCLKLDFAEQIVTGCGARIIVEQTVNDLLNTTCGIVLSEIDQGKGICGDCLGRLEVMENTLKYFSKKNQRWRQMQELIGGEDVHWHGNNYTIEKDITEQKIQEPEQNSMNSRTNLKNEIKVEIEDIKLQDSNSQPKYNETHIEVAHEYVDSVPLVQVPMNSNVTIKSSSQPLEYSSGSISSTSQPYTLSTQSCAQSNETTSNLFRPNISNHVKTTPNLSSPHICHICSKSFTKASGLREHLQIHQGIKNFKCQYCGNRFRTRKNWKIHETLHENGQAFTCAICLKSFTHPSNLKRHEQQLHAGTKAYSCNLCGKRFSRQNHLHVHLRAHTGEKPYQCPKCGGCFSTSSGLSKHRRKVCRFTQQESNVSV